MTTSNKDRCHRYYQRKKLKDRANYIFRSWQLGVMERSSHSPQEVKASLDSIITLPYNWTEKDYSAAMNALNTFSINLFSLDHVDLQKNLQSRAIKKAYTTMVQTLELATQNLEEQTEAIWQIANFLGRKLVKQQIVPETDANALCLATLPRLYRKPEWLESHLKELLKVNCHNIKVEYSED